MGQSEYKRVTRYSIIVSALAMVVISSALTVYVVQHGTLNLNSDTGRQPAYKHYDTYAGHDVCKEAIIRGARGQVIALEADNRSAAYQSYNDTNVLTFSAEIRPRHIPFLSEQRSTYHSSIRCATSAQDNSLVNLSWLTTDPNGVQPEQ